MHMHKVQILTFENVSVIRAGMASPLIGIAGVNSLLFAAYGVSRRIISPFPQLSLKETAAAGAMAGAVNSILASPGQSRRFRDDSCFFLCFIRSFVPWIWN